MAMSTSIEIKQEVFDFITSAADRQSDCSDLVNGGANTATYVLLDILRAARIISSGQPDRDCLFRNSTERLVAVDLRGVKPDRMSDVLKFTRSIAEKCNVRPMMENGGANREMTQPEVLDDAKMSWVLTYPANWWPRAILFVPRVEAEIT